MSKSDHLMKVVLLGDRNVGKSSLLLRFTKNEFNIETRMTIGVEFSTRTMEIDKKRVSVQLWDTAGQERFRSISSVYYTGASGVMLLYDISNRDTFDSLSDWLDEVRANTDRDVVCLLVGNKCDLEHNRQVSTEQGAEFARRENMLFVETSALDSSNVEEAFMVVLRTIVRRGIAPKLGVRPPGSTLKPLGAGESIGVEASASDPRKKCC